MAEQRDMKRSDDRGGNGAHGGRADEPVEVDPRPHWIPFVFIIGIAVPLLVLFVLGTILFG